MKPDDKEGGNGHDRGGRGRDRELGAEANAGHGRILARGRAPDEAPDQRASCILRR